MILNGQLAHNRRFRLTAGLCLAGLALFTLLRHSHKLPTPQAAAFSRSPDSLQPVANLPPPTFAWSQQEVDSLSQYEAHNYPNRDGHTFATLLCTRDPSADDIYLLATRALIYHFLWRTESKSPNRPFTVFVAPFVPQWKRDILMAEGARVIEIPLIEMTPKVTNFNSERWKDQFTKLNMWNQTQFKKIVYFDSDAFPIHHVDELFDLTPTQHCNEGLLPPEDRPYTKQICDYIFAGVPILNQPEVGVNGGLLIFSPEVRMHQRLLRMAPQMDSYDSELMEQGLVEWAFGYKSSFPARQLPRKWNGVFPSGDEEHTLNVIHQKIWNKQYDEEGLGWATKMWDQSWEEMSRFYRSPKFLAVRRKDGLRKA